MLEILFSEYGGQLQTRQNERVRIFLYKYFIQTDNISRYPETEHLTSNLQFRCNHILIMATISALVDFSSSSLIAFDT